MIFSVDLELLKQHKLSLNQYFLCYLITTGQFEELAAYIATFEKFSLTDISVLEERGFLINLNKDNEYFAKNFQTTETFMDIAKIGKYNEAFKEFWDTFPIKTPKGRRLKQVNKSKLEKKYNNIVKNNEKKHSIIINCLKRELYERENTRSLEYLYNIETWLNKEAWVAYEDQDDRLSLGEHYGGTIL